VSERIMDIIMN